GPVAGGGYVVEVLAAAVGGRGGREPGAALAIGAERAGRDRIGDRVRDPDDGPGSAVERRQPGSVKGGAPPVVAVAPPARPAADGDPDAERAESALGRGEQRRPPPARAVPVADLQAVRRADVLRPDVARRPATGGPVVTPDGCWRRHFRPGLAV